MALLCEFDGSRLVMACTRRAGHLKTATKLLMNVTPAPVLDSGRDRV